MGAISHDICLMFLPEELTFPLQGKEGGPTESEDPENQWVKNVKKLMVLPTSLPLSTNN